MSEQKPALPPEFVDVYPTEGRRVRIETGELLPSGHVLRGVRRTTCLLRLERDGDVVLKPHEAEQAEDATPPAPTAGDPPAGDPPTSADAGGSKPRKS
ncbi:MAG: hypothetical protein GY873_30130 [Bosea sp.]|uniref:hypothetical protein n=1 Tax=Bosea sp. (in: a-proteobacteria) TaxID=1871050 RepID=UPI0023A15502|nr:hypothetical protein [Bosea sp. (in: a-proteobacteria)]MCP4738454.1 hypothetical protein [Bosea sp. (in: a-proteobacteria)]